jgi:hypothetical protein
MAGAGSNGAKIVLDADASKVVGEAKKAGDELKKAARAGGSIGDEFEKMPGKIAKTVVGVGALLRAVAAVSQELNKVQTQAADANRQSGGAALDRDIAGARLGLTSTQSQALSTPGARSTQEMDQMLGSMVGLKGPGGGAIDQQSVFRAAQLYRGGGFDRDEIVEALRNGTLDDLQKQAGDRVAGFGQESQQELAVRDFENQNSAAALAARADRGLKKRLAQSAIDARNAKHPGGQVVQGIASGLTAPIGGDALIEMGDTAAQGNGLLKQIATNTAPRPALARPPGTD